MVFTLVAAVVVGESFGGQPQSLRSRSHWCQPANAYDLWQRAFCWYNVWCATFSASIRIGVVKTFRCAAQQMVDPHESDFDYVGDTAWDQYAECFLDDWDDCPIQSQLLSAVGGDRNIAIVMWRHFQGHALDSLNKPWPALAGVKPNDCLQTQSGINRLRQALIEFPYP